MNYLFALSIIIGCFSQGAREGFTFTSIKVRKSNPIVYHNGKDNAGLFSYHQLRILELLSYLGALLSYNAPVDLLWVVAFFPVYELVLTYIPRSATITFTDVLTYQKGKWSWGVGYIDRAKYYIKYLTSMISLVILIIWS